MDGAWAFPGFLFFLELGALQRDVDCPGHLRASENLFPNILVGINF